MEILVLFSEKLEGMPGASFDDGKNVVLYNSWHPVAEKLAHIANEYLGWLFEVCGFFEAVDPEPGSKGVLGIPSKWVGMAKV